MYRTLQTINYLDNSEESHEVEILGNKDQQQILNSETLHQVKKAKSSIPHHEKFMLSTVSQKLGAFLNQYQVADLDHKKGTKWKTKETKKTCK